MNRLLGASEHAIWLFDQIAPLHFALMARIIGEFSIAQLEQALIEVQQQHPMLRVGIAPDESEQPWFVEDAAHIPLRVVERQEEQHWQQEVERELFHPFNWAQAPLLRVVLLQSTDSSKRVSEIIVTCHHSIGDGLSSAYLLRDILQALSSPAEQRSPLSEHPPFEDLIPQKVSTPQSVETAANESEDTPPAPLLSTEAALSQPFAPQLLSWSLSFEETASIIAHCRQEQTTVHAAICAAFLLAIANEGETRSPQTYPLKCLSSINLRKYLSPPIQEEFGFYAWAEMTSHPSISDLGLWEIARSLKEQLNQKMSINKIFGDIPARQALMSTSPSSSMMWQLYAEQYRYELLVSNLGYLNFFPQFGQLQLEAIYGPATMSTFRENHGVIGVATVQGRMFFTLTYSGTEMSPDQAEQFQQKAMRSLLA